MSQVLSEKDYIELECEYSRIQHELMKLTWKNQFASPIEQELRKGKDFQVLDVACGGSGSWLLQLSGDYPLAKFVGVDILPIFPKDHSQDNLQFIQGDILKGLPFKDNSFDFVHMRFVTLEFHPYQWKDMIKELVRVCKPGGWIELLEHEEVKFLSPTYKRLIGSLIANLIHKGTLSKDEDCSFSLYDDISYLLDTTGKIDAIYGDERFIPLGNWGGDIGKLALKTQFIISRIHNATKWLKLSEEEYEEIMNQFVTELEQYHTYIVCRRLFCQKE